MTAAVAVGLSGACANQAAPPGGPEDRRPPIVVRTEPDTFAVMLDRNGRVRFHFNERISEQVTGGDIASAVTVSPRTGPVRVSHGRTSLTVSVEGGFLPGQVYRVTLLPVVNDLFGNRMTEAFEVVFSTGEDVPPTGTLAGEIWDRLSGRGVPDALVRAVGTDSLVHVARTDQQGIFAFRYLPSGDYVLTGFLDRDRDFEVGEGETRGSTVVSMPPGDTLVVDVPVLAPDTTPAVPGAASALDSVTVVVQFDDFLDPGASADQIGVRLRREGGDAPVVSRLFHERAYERYVDQVEDSFARLDSIEAAQAAQAAVADTLLDAAGDTVPGDTLQQDPAPPPEPRPTPPRLGGPTGGQDAPPGRSRPGRRIVGQLDGPLEPGVEYQIRITDVVNVNGLAGGGGDVTLSYEPPPVPDSAAAPDSTAVPPDSAAVPDTAGVGR